jgi:iron-sulfur cluster repair protein YtfE (RIC family)
MAHVIEKLRQDHEKVVQLFEKLAKTGNGSTNGREELCRQLIAELEAHTEFEEQVFYPAVEKAGDEAEEEVEEAVDEHQEVKDMLAQLASMDVDDDEFLELVSEIQEAVEAHVQHEEDDIFPLAEEELETSEATQMAQQHDTMVKEYMQQHAG